MLQKTHWSIWGRLGVLIAFGVATSTAWGQAARSPAEWNGVVAAAKKEGRVFMYTAVPVPVTERIVAGFRKAYPDLPLEYIRQNSGPLLARLDQERQAGGDTGDVFLSTEIGWFSARNKEGALIRPSGPALAGFPPRFLRDGAIAVLGMEPMVMVYNKNLVSTPPKGYADLLRPEFRNRIGITDLAATFVVAWYDWMERGQGRDYYPKLREQNPKIFAGSGPAIVQAIAAGEIAVGNFVNSSSVTPMQELNAPVGLTVPNPSLGFQYLGGVLGWSKRPNGALVLMDYLMSREGQSAWHTKNDSASPLPGISGSLDASTITTWNPDDYPPDVVQKYRDYWNKSLK